MPNVHVVVGGQFGSEAKGHVTAWLSRQRPSPAVVRIGGPNAGHTVIDRGRPYRMRHVPVGFVNPKSNLYIAPGSEIDPEVLWDEIDLLDNNGYKVSERIAVDWSATMITDRHKADEEELIPRIGSTAKGIGRARADRVMREAVTYGSSEWRYAPPTEVTAALRNELARGNDVIIEGAQGYGLGFHTEYYPYTTSCDCRAVDAMAAVGLSPWEPLIDKVQPWVVMRTYPIRVAGNSGPLEQEIDFTILSHELGVEIEPERTTVTNRIRRIGRWEPQLALSAIYANGGAVCNVVLTFLDYWYPELAGRKDLPDHVLHRLNGLSQDIGAPIVAVSTGPNTMVML